VYVIRTWYTSLSAWLLGFLASWLRRSQEAKKPVERGAMSIGSYLRSTQQLKRAIFGFLSSS